MLNGKKVYIAGKMTGKEDLGKKDFEEVERKLKELYPTIKVLNPHCLPKGLEYEDYMKICFAMIDVADAVCMLPDWSDSPGANREFYYAHAKEKMIAFYENHIGE